MHEITYFVKSLTQKWSIVLESSRNMSSSPPSVHTRAASCAVATCPAAAVGSGCPSLGLAARDKETTMDNIDGRSYVTLWSLEPLC